MNTHRAPLSSRGALPTSFLPLQRNYMKQRSDRFAYREAEKILDSYAKSSKRTVQFQRAYKKFKFAVFSIAYIDFGYGGRPDEENLSYAWEDVQVAFYGYGEPSMTGCVLQLWAHVPKNERNRFERVISSAFRKAEAATGTTVSRRYLSRWRRKPVRRPEQGFDLPTLLPINGPRLRAWAEDAGEDVNEIEDQLYWLEMADREVQRSERGDSGPEPTGDSPFLQLLPDPTTGGSGG